MPVAVDRLLVDADDAIARRLQEGDDLAPAEGLFQYLHCEVAWVAMTTYFSAIGRSPVRNRQTRRRLGRVEAENVGRRAVQPDMAEIDRLVDALDVIEKQPDAIGRIISRPALAVLVSMKLMSG